MSVEMRIKVFEDLLRQPVLWQLLTGEMSELSFEKLLDIVHQFKDSVVFARPSSYKGVVDEAEFAEKMSASVAFYKKVFDEKLCKNLFRCAELSVDKIQLSSPKFVQLRDDDVSSKPGANAAKVSAERAIFNAIAAVVVVQKSFAKADVEMVANKAIWVVIMAAAINDNYRYQY